MVTNQAGMKVAVIVNDVSEINIGALVVQNVECAQILRVPCFGRFETGEKIADGGGGCLILTVSE